MSQARVHPDILASYENVPVKISRIGRLRYWLHKVWAKLRGREPKLYCIAPDQICNQCRIEFPIGTSEVYCARFERQGKIGELLEEERDE